MSVKHSLLSQLTQGEATATMLQHGFADSMGKYWTLNIGQVSQTLDRLERDGLVRTAGTTTGPTGRKAELYAITEAGRAELDAWWTTALVKPAVERDELVMKVVLATGHEGVNLITVLDNQRFATLEAIRELNTLSATVPAQRGTQRLAIERQIFDLEAQLRWLDRVEALSPAPATPTDTQATEQKG